MSKGLAITLLISIVLFYYAVDYRHDHPDFELKNYEFILFLLPLLIYGVFTGKLSRLELFGLKFESKFQDSIKKELSKNDIRELIAVDANVAAPEEEEGKLRILRKRPNTLRIKLKDENIDNQINGGEKFICNHLDVLARAPTFKYVVFFDSTEKFKAFVPAKSIAEKYLSDKGTCEADKLIEWIQDKMGVREISDLPGFIWDNEAIPTNSKKSTCLKKMQELNNVDVIPVVNKNREVVGVVERSELITSIIIDVSTEL